MAPKILIVLTSHDQLGDTGTKTGFWLEELAAPYYVFKDAGAAITLASPKGGEPPLDPKSAAPESQTDDTRRFENDAEAMAALKSTTPLADIDPARFDAIFYPGGHGPLWDLSGDTTSIRLIEAFWSAGKPVGAVCHAPAVLADVKDGSGAYLVSGKQLTGFTNSEEAAVGLSDIVPFLLEDRLQERGARFLKADDFTPHVVVDGRLVTGQNPPSSAQTARQLLAVLT
jgi:putative intracellular protease/amidase